MVRRVRVIALAFSALTIAWAPIDIAVFSTLRWHDLLIARAAAALALLDQQFRFALRHGTPITVLFADIDRFKAVNDRHGHEAGDRVLAEVAAAFRDSLRQSDVPVRWGGEEFVVVLPHADAASTSAFLERLRARGFGATPAGEPITVSIGIGAYPGDAAASAHELVALADRRMYAAKQAGAQRMGRERRHRARHP